MQRNRSVPWVWGMQRDEWWCPCLGGGAVNSCFGSRDIKLETPVTFLSVWSSREGLAAGDGGALARCGYSEPQA